MLTGYDYPVKGYLEFGECWEGIEAASARWRKVPHPRANARAFACYGGWGNLT